MTIAQEPNELTASPLYGGLLVARAWVDSDFKRLLLDDATQAVKTFPQIPELDAQLRAVENTDQVHNVIVCRPCSCYPLQVLGPHPTWYSSDEYRNRIVNDTRNVLTEFGLTLASGVEIRVWDSDPKRRYLVVPQRPANTDGFTETQLAALVTRDAMIGTAVL